MTAGFSARLRAVVATPIALVALVALVALLAPADAEAAPAKLVVTGLSTHSGGTWGEDRVIISGVGFGGPGNPAVSAVYFGPYPADRFSVLNPTTIQAFTSEVPNVRAATDVRVQRGDDEWSPRVAADVFTFVVPTADTKINGGWTANQARAVSDSMLNRAAGLNAMPVAPNPGYWTPAMGKSAVQRAAGWLGMPYAWAGGTATGPSFGACGGDGAITTDCLYQGFDCSGLTLYAWGKYEHLAHFAATQLTQAGTFHPPVSQLQPGDLLFFSGGGPVVSHVVMYAGRGMVIQSSESGWPVRYSSLAAVMSGHPVYFGATRPMSLGVQGAPPRVSSISLSHSPIRGGVKVTIRGANLDTASEVVVGGVGTYSFAVNSPNALTVTVPAHVAGAANIVVYNAWGSSTATPRAVLSYLGAPRVTGLSVAKAAAAGGSVVVITGASFTPGTRVYFGTTPAQAVRVLSSTHLSVVAPAHATGAVTVEVRTSYGRSNQRGISYLEPSGAG